MGEKELQTHDSRQPAFGRVVITLATFVVLWEVSLSQAWSSE